jgi:AcrR family transcriptional regulator
MPATAIRKSQIRQAAVVLFSERGFYGTGMEDIAARIGMRASSLYNHVRSKHDLLAEIMIDTMQELIVGFDRATAEGDRCEQLRAAMEAHVRYHGTHRDEAHIGNRELASLQQPQRDQLRDLRRQYARRWQALIQDGIDDGTFHSLSAQLSAYALLEMGIGVSQWYRQNGPLSLDEIAFHYGDMALRQVGATPAAWIGSDALVPDSKAAMTLRANSPGLDAE